MANRGAIVPRHRLSSDQSTRGGPTESVRLPPPSLLCNLCQKPLATTCFLCACDCIFCEDCTYSHFEQSSQCPICTRTLSENDFTELVVADATSATNDIAKTSLQALFSKQSKSSHNSKALPLSDLCFSLVRQIDVVKQSTKFLLKQLLMNSNSQGRKVSHVLRANENLKNEVTHLKQGQSSQRLQYEQANTDLKNRLTARESTIEELNRKLAEKERMLNQFRRLHSGEMEFQQPSDNNLPITDHGSNSASHYHQIPRSGGGGGVSHRQSRISPNSDPPPLKGLMMQRQQQHAAQQRAFNSRRGPNMSSAASIQSSITGMTGGRSRITNLGGGGGGMGPMVSRPFSSAHSTGSNSLNSVTPRVRDLSHGVGFNFSGGGSSGGHQRLNKRRRTAEATPAHGHVMSPNTAFTLNQGNHSINRGQRWLQRDAGSFSRG